MSLLCLRCGLPSAPSRDPSQRPWRATVLSTCRDLVRNWAPDAERSSNGFWKGLSLKAAGSPAAPSSGPSCITSSGGESSTDQY